MILKRICTVFGWFLFAVQFLGCQSKTVTMIDTPPSNFEDKMNSNQNWQNHMQLLEKTMMDVYPLAIEPMEFEAKKNEVRIVEGLRKLSQISKKVNHSPMTQLNDPTLSFISFDFSEQMSNAARAFEAGKKDYARFEMLKTTQYCVECHTQSNKGPNFGFSQFAEKIQRLPVLDQAEMYSASRRFDEAIGLYKKFFEQNDVGWDGQFRAESAAHNALSILIRYQRNPEKSNDFLSHVLKSSFIPMYLKNMITLWIGDIKVWQKETKSQKPTLTMVKVWIERSNSRTFEYGKLGSEVWNQLAITYLHEFLDDTKLQKIKADVLWLLGSSYINGTNYYQSRLGQKYLEACIRTYPNSPHAQRCYSKYEEFVFDSNTGSAGTFMSIEDDLKLKELKKLAQ